MSEYSQFALSKLQALSEQIIKDLNCYRVSTYCYDNSFCISIKKVFDFSNLESLQKISKSIIEYFNIESPEVLINSKKEMLIVKSDKIEIEIEVYS